MWGFSDNELYGYLHPLWPYDIRQEEEEEEKEKCEGCGDESDDLNPEKLCPVCEEYKLMED